MTDLDPRALESELDEKLPCDVHLPGVKFNRGCKLSTLLAAIRRREDWPDEDARLSQPQAGEPVVDRQRCVDLHQKLGRDAMLRQNDPVQTIYDFAASVWQDGFSEGYRDDEHTSDASPQPALAVKAGERPLVDQLTGALRFILAFYEPGQRYLDTEAWKQAEAGGRLALARGEAALVASPPLSGEVAASIGLRIAARYMAGGAGIRLAKEIADEIKAAFPTASAPATADGWRPTHRHVKRGSEYVLIGIGRMQSEDWQDEYDRSVDMSEVAIYRNVDDGSYWARPREEFEDGRFEVLPAAPTATGGR